MVEVLAEGPLGAGEATEDFHGLCRICGGTVPPSTDPSSCTATICSEQCLAKALVAYWASQGATADVVLRGGYARLERIAIRRVTEA
jgi:hypothetical protein